MARAMWHLKFGGACLGDQSKMQD